MPDASAGELLLAQGHAAEALPLLRQAVKDGQATAKIWLGIALAIEQVEGLAAARSWYQQLPERFPGWDEAWLRWADFCQRSGDADQAVSAYLVSLDLEPKRIESLMGLSRLLLQHGQTEDAQIYLLRACGLAPERADVWNALGLACACDKQFGLANAAFAQAILRDPLNYDYWQRRVESAWRAGKLPSELRLLEKETQEASDNQALLHAFGVALGMDLKFSDSVDFFEAALALDPEASAPRTQLAVTLMKLDRNAEAVPLLRQLYAAQPDNAELANDLAVSLMRSHWHAEAGNILSDSLEHHGWRTSTACNLTIIRLWQGRQEEAAALARRAIAEEPAALQPRRVLANVMPYLESASAAEAFEVAKSCAQFLARPSQPVFAPRKAGAPIRIGLLSNLLRTHPAGWLTVGAFEALDRSQFEITVFGANSGDSIARRIGTIAHGWFATDELSDAAVADLIRARNIDVLIDLSGWGDHGRISVCSQRAAPIQIKWVGMQNHSTGIAEVDYMISDRWETPPELAHLYSEKLLNLPDGYVCYSPPAYAPDVGPLPALANGFVTFGCFNNLAKINQACVALWSRILRELPDARIIFKTHQFSEAESRELLWEMFAEHDIPRHRILLEGRSPHREFLDAYNKIDIALDPFPYSGGLGTCEALWMGVPTVTLPGEGFASRHSLSHLSNVGLADWVARNAEDYVALAIEKSRDLDGLVKLRGTLRARTKVSPLCDGPRFGRNLGNALKKIVEERASTIF